MLMLFLRFKKVPSYYYWSQENRRHINQKWLLCWFLLKNMTHTFYIIELEEDQIYQIELNWIFGKNQTQKRSRPLISWPISDSAINSNSLFSSNFILAVTLAQRYTYRVLQTIQMKLILLCVWQSLPIWAALKLL